MSIIFPIKKSVPLHSLRLSHMSKIGAKLTMRRGPLGNFQYLWSPPFGIISGMLLRNNNTMLEAMMTSIRDGPHFDGKGTRQYQISQISSIPCAPRWISRTLNDIRCSSTATVIQNTSKHKCIF